MKCYSCDKVIAQCECGTTAVFMWAFLHGLCGSYLVPGFVKILMNYKKMKALKEIETSGEKSSLNLMRAGIMTQIGLGEIKQLRKALYEKYPFLRKLEAQMIGETGGALTGSVVGTLTLYWTYGRITGYHVPSNVRMALLSLSLGSTYFLMKNNYLAANSYMYNNAKAVGKVNEWMQFVGDLSTKKSLSLYRKDI